MNHDPKIWRSCTHRIQNPVCPRPSVDLTTDGFVSYQPQPPSNPTYEPPSQEHPGPSAQDEFETHLDQYFDDAIPATAVRRTSDYDNIFTVYQRVLPSLSPVRKSSWVESLRAPGSGLTEPCSPPCDADFTFYGDQRCHLFPMDRRALVNLSH